MDKRYKLEKRRRYKYKNQTNYTNTKTIKRENKKIRNSENEKTIKTIKTIKTQYDENILQEENFNLSNRFLKSTLIRVKKKDD